MALEGSFEDFPDSGSEKRIGLEGVEGFQRILRIKQDSIRDTIRKMLQSPPLIENKKESDQEEVRIIEIDDERLVEYLCPEDLCYVFNDYNKNTVTHRRDLTLFIPITGEKRKTLLEQTGMEDIDQILDKLHQIAVDAKLGFIAGYDGESKQAIVNFHMLPGKRYGTRLPDEVVDFLALFERELL